MKNFTTRNAQKGMKQNNSAGGEKKIKNAVVKQSWERDLKILMSSLRKYSNNFQKDFRKMTTHAI